MANGRAGDSTRLWQVVLGVVALAVIVVGALVLFGGEDDEDDGTAATTTEEVTTTTEEATTTTEEEATTTTAAGPISDEEAYTVVWPDPFGDLRYDDPLDAVEGYAEELVGFDDPVYGELMEGDARSGEVEVRAVADGAVTTVLVRQMSDDNWYVLGSITPNIELDDPIPGTAIDHPLLLSGRANAFEGTVQVAVFERGDTEPLGEGFVTGSMGELGPFSGEVAWDNPGGGWGVVLLYTLSMEDGSVWEAASIPVGFIGGD